MEHFYKVLLVEDSASDAELILYELKRSEIQFDYRRVELEADFVSALDEFQPDIVLADFSLPRFNALRALHIIKEKQIIMPFILVTGSQSEEIAVECIKSGADDYILKKSLTRLPTAFFNSIRIKSETRNRQEAEERLRESEAYKTAILSTAADSIITLDEKGAVEMFNNAAETLFGYSSEEIYKKSISIIIPDFQKLDVVHEFNGIIANKTKGVQNQVEYIGRKKNGTVFFIEMSVDKVKLSEKTFFVLIVRDITNRKLSEEDIKYKNRELNTFVYRVSHDLKGPISSILGLLDVAAMELKGHPQAMRYNKLIRQSAFKLDSTLVELLKVLHIRESEIEYSDVNIFETTKEIIDRLTSMALLENIHVSLNIDKRLLFKTGKDFLSIIIEKIILNSIHFRKDFSSENYIRITAISTPNELVLEVKDNGVGIDKSIQSKVFDMFFRGNNVSKGSGLGLYLTKNVVEKLNGVVEIESEKDNGTLVRVKLPTPED